MGPIKPYLAEKTSLQSSNCNIMGLAATVVLFANEAHCFFRACSLQNEVADPPVFYISDISDSSSFMVKFSEKSQC